MNMHILDTDSLKNGAHGEYQCEKREKKEHVMTRIENFKKKRE